jgi:SPP1 family predicted phage head-tail adaptor
LPNTIALDPTVYIGDLRHRVWLQTPVTNGAGEITSWSNAGPNQIWARIEPLGGNELFAAQQIYPEANTSITIRYRPGVTSAMRILYGTRTFDIKDASDVEERHRRIDMICVERPADRVT